MLAPHLASGKQLIVAAAMVGDEDDFGVWTWRCKDWTSALVAALRYVYGSDAARTFERATRAPRHSGGWQAAVGEELGRLQQTLEMLGELSSELQPTNADFSLLPAGS